MPRPPRMSVATRWGLDETAQYVAVPVKMLHVAVALGASPAQLAVIIGLAHAWRPERGTTIDVSLAELAEVVPLDRSRISRVLRELADAGLITYLPADPGRRRSIGIAPLLAIVRRPVAGIASAQHLLLRGRPELLRGRNGGVARAPESVARVASGMTTQSQSREDQDARAGVTPAFRPNGNGEPHVGMEG